MRDALQDKVILIFLISLGFYHLIFYYSFVSQPDIQAKGGFNSNRRSTCWFRRNKSILSKPLTFYVSLCINVHHLKKGPNNFKSEIGLWFNIRNMSLAPVCSAGEGQVRRQKFSALSLQPGQKMLNGRHPETGKLKDTPGKISHDEVRD